MKRLEAELFFDLGYIWHLSRVAFKKGQTKAEYKYCYKNQFACFSECGVNVWKVLKRETENGVGGYGNVYEKRNLIPERLHVWSCLDIGSKCLLLVPKVVFLLQLKIWFKDNFEWCLEIFRGCYGERGCTTWLSYTDQADGQYKMEFAGVFPIYKKKFQMYLWFLIFQALHLFFCLSHFKISIYLKHQ